MTRAEGTRRRVLGTTLGRDARDIDKSLGQTFSDAKWVGYALLATVQVRIVALAIFISDIDTGPSTSVIDLHHNEEFRPRPGANSTIITAVMFWSTDLIVLLFVFLPKVRGAAPNIPPDTALDASLIRRWLTPLTASWHGRCRRSASMIGRASARPHLARKSRRPSTAR